MTIEIPNCVFCGAPVDTSKNDGWYRGVQGWETRRKGGGANQIVLREVQDRFAHGACIKMEKSGIHQHQGQLL